MKRAIKSGTLFRNREEHIREVSKINSDLIHMIESLEKQRSEAHNGDSSGKLLSIVNSLKREQQDLNSYLKSCREAVNWW